MAGEGHGRNVRPKLTLDTEDDEFIIESLGKSLDSYESTLFDQFNIPESRDAAQIISVRLTAFQLLRVYVSCCMWY
jgi:hypothetical protein